ncbi:translation initiation factor IF-2 [Equus caballus]|uniref:translation initiation factor IF-2 n=1 Tax=Equus caballus TaxID=9796 RepID=UPI0038B3474F
MTQGNCRRMAVGTQPPPPPPPGRPRPAPPAAPPAASAAGRASLRKSRCPEAAEARGRRRGRPGTAARPRRALCSFSPTTCLSGGPEGARRQGRPRRGSASASWGRSRREGEGPSPSPPSPLSSFVASTLGLRAALAVPPPAWECAGWTHSEHRELAPGDPGPRRGRPADPGAVLPGPRASACAGPRRLPDARLGLSGDGNRRRASPWAAPRAPTLCAHSIRGNQTDPSCFQSSPLSLCNNIVSTHSQGFPELFLKEQ